MFAKWKAAVLAQRKRQEPMTPEGEAPNETLSTAPPPAKTRKESKPRRHGRYRADSSDDDADGGFLSDSDSDGGDRGDRQRQRGASEPKADSCDQQNVLQRMLTAKNRLVQRVYVMLKMAEASKDMYFQKKQLEYEQAVKQLEETKEIIELYAQSLYDLSVAMRGIAGNSSDVRSQDHDQSLSFLVAAETIEDKGHEFMEQVHERILRSIDDRIEDLEQLGVLLRERANLQIDVDYAKRVLLTAQERGDVNVIADKKQAFRLAQLRRQEATKKIAPLLRHYDNKQEIELDFIITDFASLTKQFFRDGAALLRSAEPSQRSRHSNATLLSARRLIPVAKDSSLIAFLV